MPLPQAVISHGAHSWTSYLVSLPLASPLSTLHISAQSIFWNPCLHFLHFSASLGLLASHCLQASIPQGTPVINWTGLDFAPLRFFLPTRPSSTPSPVKPSFCGISSTTSSVPSPYCLDRGDPGALDLLELCLRLSSVPHGCDSSNGGRPQSPAAALPLKR